MTEYEPKRSTKDKILDRLPIFGRVRRIKGWVRRKKGWIYFALIIAILFVVKPVLTIFAEIFKIFGNSRQALPRIDRGQIVISTARTDAANAGKLIQEGLAPRRACEVAITTLLSDEKEVQVTIAEVVSAIFP